MSLLIRGEGFADFDAIRGVNRLAFGRLAESRLIDALRDGGYSRLSLVAEIDGNVVGHILFSPLEIMTDGRPVNALSLAPLAVMPSHQRRGIGSALVRQGLQLCAEAGNGIVVVLGHPAFYPRFGFSAKLAERLKAPYSGPAFMALELIPGALNGIEGLVRYPPPFDSL